MMDGPTKTICMVALTVVLVGSFTAVQAVPTVADHGPFRVTFYNNGDSDGTNTGEHDWAAQQRADVGASIQTWDSYITNVPGRQIQLHMFWQEMDAYGTGVLGGSYSPSNGDGTTAWNYGEHVWRDGVNYSAPWSGWDTTIRYDITAAGYSWNFGAASPGGAEIDFRSVVTHEVGHSIGFTTTYDSTPAYDDWGNTWGTASNPYAWAGYNGLKEWEKDLIDQLGNRPQSGTTGTPGNFDQVGDVDFTGANAVAYYGGPVPVYSPNTWQGGSSLSHLDEGTIVPEPLMTPFIALGELARGPTGLELEVLKDMGYSIVPEPATLALLAVGGAMLLRRRRRPVDRP